MPKEISKDQILNGHKRSLAKAITLIESSLEKHQKKAQSLLEALLPHSGKSIRIGLSGSPGVGKSTFIENFGLLLTRLGKKVAVLAVDPSSPVSGGSILGDKTRMEKLSQDPNAFIRPSPSSGSLGGVARKTRESLLLCEAAGYDVILVETVGVGQSEYEVHSMVDFFLVLILPNAGDELQGIKKGIIELADAIAVNKADGESLLLAKQTASQYKGALHLINTKDSKELKNFWQPQVIPCSALKKKGLQDIWNMIENFVQKSQSLNKFSEHRNLQNKKWIEKLISEMMERKMHSSPDCKKTHDQKLREVLAGKTTPYLAAQAVIQSLFKN